jgi:predicted Zn-dependent peptidase
VYTPEEVIKEVNKVSIEDLHQVAQQVFRREKINLALIGPLEKEKKRIYTKLNLG